VTNRQPTTRRGWWRLLLAAIAAALVTLLGVTSASAATVPELETRVGASTPTVAHIVGVHESVSAGQRWGNAPPQAETVVATGVAAKTGASAIEDVGDVLKGLPKGRSPGVRTVGSDQELGELSNDQNLWMGLGLVT
jgi:hypothetical protein